MTMAVEESIGTRMALTQLQSGAAMNFLQLGGAYRVDGRIGERRLVFSARGSAETFRALRTKD